MSLKGKTVVITGASRGIGLAVAKHFAKEGSNIVINYISDEDDINAISKEIESLGGKATCVKGNVCSLDDCQTLIDTTKETYGSVDVIINNAGITKDTLMMRMKESDFDAVIDVNLKGTWNVCKAATKTLMKQKSGKIINISSVVALIGNPGQVNYVASKAGVIGMTKSLAKEFGSRGVTVNAVAPGFIQTDMTNKLSDDIIEHYKKQIPLGTLGTVDDIANAVLFLASDKANYITGQILSVNGGMV